MPTNHDAKAAIPITGPASKTLVRNLLVSKVPYVLADTDDAQDIVAVDPDTGAAIIDFLYLGRVFHYDSADTTTAHDGTTCLVSYEGRRYKLAVGTDVFAYSVINVTRTAPTVSPVLGQAFLIANSATGAWSGHDGEITVYTARGWEFIDFGIGRFIYDEAEDAYYHKDASGAWVLGFGTQALADGTVAPSALLGGGDKVRWIVENQTTDTPPSVVNGRAYIIGPSPTGAWVGHAAKIAHGEAGSWVIYTPAEGWRAYDKANDGDFVYSGSAWLSSYGQFAVTLRGYANSASTATWNKPARLFKVRVTVVGGGGNGKVGTPPGTSGSTASFGSHCSATGGAGGEGGIGGGAGGTGIGGDINLVGSAGYLLVTTGTSVSGGVGAGPLQPKGHGGTITGSGSAAATGGGGGCAIKEILASALGANEVVTTGNAAQANSYVLVEEYTFT